MPFRHESPLGIMLLNHFLLKLGCRAGLKWRLGSDMWLATGRFGDGVLSGYFIVRLSVT